MKTRRLFFIAPAAFVLAACAEIDVNVDVIPAETISTVTFSAVMDNNNPGSKAVIGTNPETSKPLTFWENGDEITVYSQGTGDSGNQSGYTFSTTLGANASSADFTYTGDGWVAGSAYMAIYPATGSRAVNFTGEGEIYKMAAVDVPHSQTLVANSFDRNAMVATAYSTDNTFAFKSAVALLKFRVSDADVKGGTVVVANKKISGRFRADLSTTSPYEPILTDYDQTTYDNVEFSIDGSTSLSTGTDYYVAVRPTELDTDLKVYLNGYLVKTVAKAQLGSIVRNKIYNLGTLSKAGAAEILLNFDFAGTPPTVDPAWPTAAKDYNNNGNGTSSIERVYPLYGTNYSFVLADPADAQNSQVYWLSGSGIVFNAAKRYFGFPAISGYKLTKVVCYKKSGSTDAKFKMVSNIVNSSSTPTLVTGGDEQAFNTNGAYYTFDLSGTEVNTRYYLYCSVKGTVATFTLTYEPD